MTKSVKIIKTMFHIEKDPELCPCECHKFPEAVKHVMPCCRQCDVCKKHIDGLFWEQHVIKCQLPENIRERVESEKELFKKTTKGRALKRDALYYEYLHKGAFVGDERVMDDCLERLKKLDEE